MIAANDFENQLQGLMAQQAQVQSIRNSLNLMPHQKGQLKAQIQQAEGDLENARLQLSYTEIKSPFDVQIASVNNERAEYVQRGQTLFEANDISAVEIEAQFIPGSARPVFMSVREDIKNLDMNAPSFAEKLGITAIARAPGHRIIRHSWKAELSRFSDSMDTETRTMGLIFTIRNTFERKPNGNQSPPVMRGMYCEVELRGRTIKNALVIPRSALHPKNTLYLMTPQQTLETRTIEPGPAIDDFLLVREGIAAGEQLILSDVIPAVSGMKLRPVVDNETLEELKLAAGGTRQ